VRLWERNKLRERERRIFASFYYTGRFIMFSEITSVYNKKTKGPTLMELFAATGKIKKFFFDN
jgi:hypothetical protein